MNDFEWFVEKWSDKLSGSEVSLNLLKSPAENDFAGMLEITDQSNVDEFVVDLYKALRDLGKVEKLKRMKLSVLVDAAKASRSQFEFTNDENLPANTLTVIEDVTSYLRASWNDYGKRCAEFCFERLSSIVDNRYCLVVGTASELSAFLDENRKLTFTFGQHRMKLATASIETVYEHYLDCLDVDLRRQATVEFQRRFMRFVKANEDDLPFHGDELADYLAKYANARHELVLPRSRYEEGDTREQLNNLIGLERVKVTIEDLRCLALAYKLDLRRGADVSRMHFHMLFEGNPGTGKTMVARIVARILFEIGIIPTSGFKEVTAKDLISSSVGESAKLTARAIKRARGGVLFIDEAYSLITAPKNSRAIEHGKDSLAELVKAMDEYDDLVVIMAGYRDRMREMVSTNPGLRSRIAYRLEFDDYTPEQLLTMFSRLAEKAMLRVDDEAMARLSELFAFHSRLDDFGNGRFVAQVFQRANTNRARRIEHDGEGTEDELLAQDIPTTSELLGEHIPDVTSTKEALARLIGMEDIKKEILGLENSVAFRRDARKRGMRIPAQSLHMVFSGNPGTGKTTIARIVGKLLFAMDVLPSSKFIEVTARDLVSSFVGDSADKCAEVIADARGGVLFIDEAYSLITDPTGNGSSHAKEALAELVKAMEDYRDSLVVILAGYTDEMRTLLDTNPGMSSRIGYHFDFPDYSVDELVGMFESHLQSFGFEVDEAALDAARKICSYFRGVKDFGNGRFVSRLIQETIARHSEQYDHETFSLISADDVPSIAHMAQISATEVISPGGAVDEKVRQRVAYHEAGHALCSLAISGQTDITEITVDKEDRGGVLGHVLHSANANLSLTVEELRRRITIHFGGMAAEQVVYGSYTAGNADDLEKATADAIRYVACYGMSDLGFVQYVRETDEHGVLDLPPLVQDKVNEVLTSAFAEACAVVEQHRATMDLMAAVLMETGILTGDHIHVLWDQRND